ncbi:PIN domain-containing protein [Haloarcula onubensis]|uniref:Ribonuclease VapC n=1 Tax=Haloarcula onubensis TaxID=2950539 RepID=A0ABU2FUQ7_9EURY|nr:PIN domain-containing protein [Halomicroarcula sp. S3CR25-11]MDS0284498.1 PIN domain-containing protein [Halomicroarcula sp. S3CR25-11]
MIVDTSFILDIIDGVEAAVEKERELEAESVPLVIPSMTVLELYIGVGKVATTRDERQKVEAVLDSYPLIDMTPSISRRAGRLLGERMAAADDGEGPGLGKGDAAIAATALERDEPVLAADSHFGTIPGVTHESYR